MNYLAAVSPFFGDRPGGAPRVAWDIACLMRDRGHRVAFLSRRDKPEHPDRSTHAGIEVVRFDVPSSPRLSPFRLSNYVNGARLAIDRHLASTEWDVAHVHLPLEGEALRRALPERTRFVYTAHSPAVPEMRIHWSQQGIAGKIKRTLGEGFLRRLEGRLLQRAARIHTLSDYTRKCLEEFHDVGAKVTVIPHWCRRDLTPTSDVAEARRKLGWPAKDTVLFSLRSFTGPRYGLDVAIEAIAPLVRERSDVIYVLAGDGHLRPRYQELAASLGAGNRIRFMGRVSDDTLMAAYGAADWFVLPTRYLECFGLIVLEASAMGLPIISTDAGALPELLRPISPDLIVPAGDVVALREKIRAALDGAVRPPAPVAVRDHLQKRYSEEVITPQIIDLLDSW